MYGLEWVKMSVKAGYLFKNYRIITLHSSWLKLVIVPKRKSFLLHFCTTVNLSAYITISCVIMDIFLNSKLCLYVGHQHDVRYDQYCNDQCINTDMISRHINCCAVPLRSLSMVSQVLCDWWLSYCICATWEVCVLALSLSVLGHFYMHF